MLTLIIAVFENGIGMFVDDPTVDGAPRLVRWHTQWSGVLADMPDGSQFPAATSFRVVVEFNGCFFRAY